MQIWWRKSIIKENKSLLLVDVHCSKTLLRGNIEMCVFPAKKTKQNKTKQKQQIMILTVKHANRIGALVLKFQILTWIYCGSALGRSGHWRPQNSRKKPPWKCFAWQKSIHSGWKPWYRCHQQSQSTRHCGKSKKRKVKDTFYKFLIN